MQALMKSPPPLSFRCAASAAPVSVPFASPTAASTPTGTTGAPSFILLCPLLLMPVFLATSWPLAPDSCTLPSTHPACRTLNRPRLWCAPGQCTAGTSSTRPLSSARTGSAANSWSSPRCPPITVTRCFVPLTPPPLGRRRGAALTVTRCFIPLISRL